MLLNSTCKVARFLGILHQWHVYQSLTTIAPASFAYIQISTFLWLVDKATFWVILSLEEASLLILKRSRSLLNWLEQRVLRMYKASWGTMDIIANLSACAHEYVWYFSKHKVRPPRSHGRLFQVSKQVYYWIYYSTCTS